MGKERCVDCKMHRDEMEEIPWTVLVGGKWALKCKPCRKKEIENKIKLFQKEKADLDYNNCIVCPHCGEGHEPDGDGSAFYQDGDHEFTCSDCSNEFEVSTDVSFSYSTRKSDE